jgi:hypothetical protein
VCSRSVTYFMKPILFILLFSSCILVNAQTGIIRGRVLDKNTQEAVIGANVVIEGTTTGAPTDIEGYYKITNVPVGSFNLVATSIGYNSLTKFNIILNSGNEQIVNFELVESATTLDEIVVKFDKGKSASAADMITPLSVQALTTEEIKSNPGGNFDISRVIQALPGVAGSPSGNVRNDIIIRGGAPNENVFYLDGIEIPVINHFQTQGSSGGPQGMLNVSFIEDVKLSSSAFGAQFDNALASVFEIKQREGNPERVSGNIRLSGTEIAGTLEGPINPKTNFLVSARRSYLQLLFEVLDLPIRPSFWDFQFKVAHKLDNKTTLTALGVGAIDDFTLVAPRNATPENQYILSSTPAINQWNYTTGFSLKRLIDKGFVNVALSRNVFNNNVDRFEDRQEGDESKRILKIRSQETENKLRLDVNKFVNGWKFSYGGMAQYVQYTSDYYNRLVKEQTDDQGNVTVPEQVINFNTDIDFVKYGFFGQVAKNFFNQRLLISGGLRTDMNTFTDSGNNPVNTLSPRISFSYSVTNTLNWNTSFGSYYKIPTYTMLGYRDDSGELQNKDTEYIRSNHAVTGFQFLPKEDLKFTVEGFYKRYNQYPISVRNGISLANEGGDFNAIGNEEIVSTGDGNTYGFEFSVQQKLVKSTFAVLSYTFVRSKFAGADGVMVPSSWDNRHLLSGLVGQKFKRNWEVGVKYRLAAGAPYTPFDLVQSQLNYATLGTGILDFTRLNTERLISFNQLDLRVDKKYNFKKTTLDLYIDIQNLFRFPSPDLPEYTFTRNAENTDFVTTDGQPLKQDGSNAIPLILQDQSPFFVPTIGFIFEF